MLPTHNLRALLVTDTQGDDDEAMKNIGRNLSAVLQEESGIAAKAVSPRNAIKEIRSVDILHYIGGPTYRSVLFTAWCKNKNKKLINILTFTNPIWGLIAEMAIRLLAPDYVIVSSNYWRRRAIRFGIPHSLMSVSGVDLDQFRPASLEHRNQLRRKLGLPLDRLIVLHVGHLKEDRNLKELLRVQSHSGLQVVIVGSSTTKQSVRLINMLEHSGCIVINNYQSRIEEYYQSADLYIFPTFNHKAAVQIPLSILEAMATNLPIITTRFGGLPDFFNPGLGLTYVFPEQFDDLAKIIISEIESPTQTRSLVEKFTWKVIANNLLSLYVKLLES